MPVIHQTTSRVRLHARLSGWLFWSLAASWLLLLSLWISLHIVIVPRIDEFRPWLQEQASKALGMRVELGPISAKSHGLVPEFELDHVKILDASGEVQLDLGRVTLALTPASAVQGEFSQITLEHLDLDIVRDAQGGIRVAGIPLQGSTDPRVRDWVFSQWEWVLRASTINYTDEATSPSPVRMTRIEGVLRNGLLDHRFRLDATPPEELGQRFSIRGQLKQPLLSAHAGAWEHWTGLVYAQTRQVNLGAWQKLLHGPADLSVQGSGWLRAWLQIKGGKVQGWTQDVALDRPGLNWKTANGSTESTVFKSVAGRVSWSTAGSESWSIQNAHLEPMEGPVWPMRQASAEFTRSSDGEISGGLLKIDALNLAQLREGVRWMPEEWAGFWRQAEPQGQLRQTELSWTGSVEQPTIRQWKAQAVDVSLRAGPVSKTQPRAPWPGLVGLNANLSGTASEFQGHVRLEPGTLNWPGLWEDPQKNIRGLEADVWVEHKAQISRVQLQRAQLLVDQGRLDLDAQWQGTPSDPLGRLEMTAHAPELEVSLIAPWLPLSIPSSVRDYVKTALPQGRALSVQAKVSGRLADFPFERAGSGEFRISAQLADVRFVTLPKALMDARTTGEWPTFQNLSGHLVFDRNTLKLDKVRARLGGAPNVHWSLLEADIRNLSQAVVSVRAQGRGPLNEVLGWWKSSPLNEWTDRALEMARAQGVADYRMQLHIPILKPESTQAQGAVVFGGNEVAFAPGAPTLAKVRGSLRFSETGFELGGVQAGLWGGEVKLEGGAKPIANQAPQVWIRAQGDLSATGLREAPELADWAGQLKSMQGNTSYNAQLQWRRGQLEMQVSSLLTGMAIQAPPGLGKRAVESLPFRLETSLTPESLTSDKVLQDQVSMRWGQALEAKYVRDLSGRQPKVLRGLIRLGAKAASSMPDQGVVLRVANDILDVDAWSDWMQPFTTLPGTGSASAWDLAPQKIELQAQSVLIQGRDLNRVQLDARKQGEAWQGRISSVEMEGDIRYLPARGSESAHFMARLARLVIPAASHTDAEQLLNQGAIDYPALDIQVQDLDLKGKKLGALELQAQVANRSDGSREWRISKLNLSNVDGVFSADGRWHKPLNATQSQTHFDFKLQLKDAGGLLQRMGTPDAVRSGTGSIEGQITWLGSPASPSAPSMSGRFRVDIERGQFLKTEPGAARLLGVLSLQALPRRLLLDFRDVFSEGFAFDFFRGDVIIEQGIAKSENLQMKGVNAVVMMDGQADIGKETQNLKVLVIPDINAGGAALVYSTINPVIGLTTFIAQYVLRRPIMESTSQQFEIDGTWSEPRITKVPVKSDAKP